MIPCFVCGNDASTGWTKGFVPAPDSQKLALCAEHNIPENRLAVAMAWRAMLERELSVLTGINAYKTAAPLQRTATVHFTGGGMLSFVCLSCEPTEQGTLCIEAPDGTRNYIPLQHVREYSVRPHTPGPSGPGAETPVTAPAAPLSFPASSVHPDDAAQEADLPQGPALPEPTPFTLPTPPVPLEPKAEAQAEIQPTATQAGSQPPTRQADIQPPDTMQDGSQPSGLKQDGSQPSGLKQDSPRRSGARDEESHPGAANAGE